MTAEKIINSNALASISRAKTQDLPSNKGSSADIFSKHLDQKLDNIDKNTNTIDKAERAEKQRQSDVNTNKINEDKQRTASRQDAQLEKKQLEKRQADERLEEKRNEDAQEKDVLNQKQLAEARQTGENPELFTSDENTTIEETPQNVETASLKNSEETINTENLRENSENQSLNNENIDKEDVITGELQSLVDENLETENSSIESTSLQTSTIETTEAKTNADEQGLAANITQLSNQQDPQSPAVKNGQPIDAANTKTQPHLESTLGQDNEGQGEGQKGQSSENQNQFNKPKSDPFAPKDGTFNANNQAQTNNAPILASTSLVDQLGKGQAIKTAGSDISQLLPVDKTGDATSSIGTNVDVKQSTPANQLRAAGYTSPTQSVAIQIAAKAQNGAQQFEIRLNPPELGRVDVRLEFTKEGQVTTHLIVERPETLDMLSKDARQLEKALSDAGVDIENDGLTFSLQDQESQGSSPQEQNEQFTQSAELENEAQVQTIEPETIYRQLSATSGLDMSV